MRPFHLRDEDSVNTTGFQNNSKLKFLTLEKTCIKIWEVTHNNADLLKRIHIKQNIKALVTADITGFLFILGENGKVLILDQEVIKLVFKI
jgi:hypothetical protein